MVYIKIGENLQKFLKDYENIFKIQFYDKDQATYDLIELHNSFIQLKLLREYLQIWNQEYSDQKIEIKTLFKVEDIYQKKEFEILEAEAKITQEDKIKRQHLLNRSMERSYQKSLKSSTNKGIFAGESVKDIEKSMSFGISFIFTLFLSGLSGFFMGKHIMGWPDIYSLILALFVTIITMLIEIVLFIIKTDRTDQKAKYLQNQENIKQQQYLQKMMKEKKQNIVYDSQQLQDKKMD